jgi:hypothetical protein
MCSAATLNHLVEALEDTAFGTTSRSYTAGLANNEVTLTFYASLRSNRNLRNIVGPRRHKDDVVLSPSSAATSATNPEFTLTDCYLESLPVINASLGELSTFDITLTGGTYSVATS